MSKINVKRVLLGGLAAAVLVNVTESTFNTVVVGKEMEEALKALHVQMGSGLMAFYILWGFLEGFVGAWLYAVARPRLGAGPKTAALVGLAIWVLLWFLPNTANALGGLIPMALTLKILAWSLVETLVAVLLAGWIYREA